eukprot:TRINITY_DN9940_c0_g2_i1.p1 TRINITY_DN9940_c0_g2~~TRINITY_DN9940_c0_g2_i1.p1  ORF type:complete len:611 (-),score=87.34 TRINITY_DN9940_c0_g2_i1:488-2320(-)
MTLRLGLLAVVTTAIWAVCSACGTIAYAALMYNPRDTVVSTAAPLWLCFISFLVSVGHIYRWLSLRRNVPHLRVSVVETVASGLCTVAFFVIIVCNVVGMSAPFGKGVGSPVATIAWATVGVVMLCLQTVARAILLAPPRRATSNIANSVQETDSTDPACAVVPPADGPSFAIFSSVPSNASPYTPSPARRRAVACCSCWTTCTLLTSAVLSLLLMGGAGTYALGATLPVYGHTVTVPSGVGTGHYQLVARCLAPLPSVGAGGGNATASALAAFRRGPVLWLEADASHGAADLIPLQGASVARGLPACVVDKAGVGFSDPYNTRALPALDPATYYVPLVDAVVGPDVPLVLVGWGGGGGVLLPYARAQSQRVAGMVLLDAYTNDVEYQVWQEKDNRSAEAAAAYRRSTVRSRQMVFAPLEMVGVPWGLMSAFVAQRGPSYNDTAPALPNGAVDVRFDTRSGVFVGAVVSAADVATSFNRYAWFYHTAKTWCTQYWALMSSLLHAYKPAGDLGQWARSAPGNAALQGKPVLAFLTNDTRPDGSGSGASGLPSDTRHLAEIAGAVAHFTGNATITQCDRAEDARCGLGAALSLTWRVSGAVADWYHGLWPAS